MRNKWLYNRYGTAVVQLLQPDNRLVDRNGHNLGYLKGDLVYSYSGKHCGWYQKGVLRDMNGYVLAFTDNANDSPAPIFPIPQIPPIPAIPQIPPIPAIPQIPRIPPIKKFAWSEKEVHELFR